MVLVSILAHAVVRPSGRSTPLYQRAPVRISTFLIDRMALSEIRSSYYQLAKIHHPDHGGCQNIFLKIHSAYKNLRANAGDSDVVDVEVCYITKGINYT